MTNTLIRAVVHIHEQLTPLLSQGGGIHGIAMILTGHIAAVGAYLTDRLVMGAVTVFQLIDSGTTSLCQQLVTHADTTDGLAAL